MIYPTLFVGLGSTGLDILERLQDLVSEEYKEKLPVFAYIYLETDKDKRPAHRPGRRDEITVPTKFPIIDNLDHLSQEYAAGRKGYLESWLNPKLLEFPGGAFTAGAGHIRMAGRLCLWENWAESTRILTEARNAITAGSNIAETNDFLRTFYARVGKDMPPGAQLVGTLPNIYVFGTLCGGTCGGMMIDVAYFLRKTFGLHTDRRQAKLQGIFTLPHASLAAQPKDEQQKKRAANAWASMLELDYFNLPSTKYEASWPDGSQMSTHEPPFDWTYLVSCAGNDANLLDQSGNPDEKALNQMVAMFLFTESVADLLELKNAIRVNFMGHVRFTSPHPVTESLPRFATCGLSAFQYPKYRIAEAAACHQAVELCQSWLGTANPEEKHRLEREAKEEWDDILKTNLPLLTRRGGGAIEDDVRRWFEEQTPALRAQPWAEAADALKKQLARFEEDKDWDRFIKENAGGGGFGLSLRDEIRRRVIGRVNTNRNLALAQSFLESLDKHVGETIARLPTKYPRPEYAHIPTAVAADLYARFVLMKKPVERETKEAAIQACCDDFISLLARVRGFRSREALEELRRKLGIGIQPTGEEARIATTLARELERMRVVLQKSVEQLSSQEQDLSQPLASTQNVALIFKDEQGGLEQDIRDLCARMRQAGPADAVRRILTTTVGADTIQQTLSDFLAGGDKTVMERMIVELRRDSLDQVQGFHIAEALLERRDMEALRLFAGRAQAQLELGGSRPEMQYPCFLVGGDRPGMPSLIRLADGLNAQNVDNRIDFGTPKATPLLDHFLVFYTETGLLYMDENLAGARLLRSRYEEEAQRDPFGLHIHRDPRMVDKLRVKRERELRGLFEILTKLFFFRTDGGWVQAGALSRLESGGKVNPENFRADGNSLYILYKAVDGTDVTLMPNEFGRKKLADDEHGFTLLRLRILDILKAIGADGYASLLNDHLKRVDAEEKTRGTPAERIIERLEEIRQAFREMRDALIPASEKTAAGR